MPQLADGAPARILVADDDESFSGVVARMLRGAGYEVETVADGAAAMEAYRAHPADLVLMDLYMPGVDGVEALIRLRRDFPHMRVIAVSGGLFLDKEEALAIAGRLGAIRTLPKPINRKTLLKTVREVLQP